MKTVLLMFLVFAAHRVFVRSFLIELGRRDTIPTYRLTDPCGRKGFPTYMTSSIPKPSDPFSPNPLS